MADLATSQPPPISSQHPPDEEVSSATSTASFPSPLWPVPASSAPRVRSAQSDSDAPSAGKSNHRRAHTSTHALPDFSFNSGASQDTSVPLLPPSRSPNELNAQNSPNRGRRHRRSASEYVGGTSSSSGSGQQPMKVDFSRGTAGDQARPPQFSFPLQKSLDDDHSNQVSVEENRVTDTGIDDDALLSDHIEPTPDTLRENTFRFHSPPTSPPARVLFSDNVQVIPQSYFYHGAKADDSLQSQVNDDRTVAESTSSSAGQGEPHKDPPSQTLGTKHGTGTLYANQTPVVISSDSTMYQLDENFDHDPTASEILTMDESHHYLPSPSISTTLNEQAYSPRSNTFETDMIDLDQALPATDDDTMDHERRINHIRNFQTARRSMHSSGAMSGFMGPGMHYHRRAESAPLLAPITFEADFEGFGSNRGMENVFEEEEEEDDLGRSTPDDSHQKDEIGDATTQDKTGLGIAVQQEKRVLDSTNTTATKHPDPQHPGTREPAKGHGAISGGNTEDSEIGMPLPLPQPPFMTPDTPSGSSFSSPKRNHFSHASSEPSLILPQSSEDIPSLISSRSTLASGAVPHQQGAGLRHLTSRHSASSTYLGKPEEVRKKRGSIVSLSRLMGSSYSDTRSDAGSEDKRCQTSDGVVVLQKTRQARLKRLFALWHRKDHTDKG